MGENKHKHIFSAELRKVSIASWILQLIPIPVGIVTAQLMSEIVSNATVGKVNAVVATASILLSVVICMKVFEILSSIALKKSSSKALHYCKLHFYDRFLSNPMSVLYQAEHGEVIENLNRDFTTVTNKSVSLYPGFWAGVLTSVAYFLFLLWQSPLIAVSLVVIAILQLIPPLIVKRFMQINYDNCRDIEAEITNQIAEGYNGLATIKLYHLKDWWLKRLAAIHKRYLKVGNLSEAALTVQTSMYKLLDNILKYGTYGLVGLFLLLQYSTMKTAVEAISLSSGLFAAVKTVFSSIPQFAVARTAETRMAKWDAAVEEETEKLQDYKIKLTDLSFKYEEKQIFSHANCIIDCGQINLIKGTNGIGKSTLLCLIAGMLSGYTGEVIAGSTKLERISDSEYLCKVLYLPQDDAKFDFPACELYEMIPSDKQPRMKQIAATFGLTNKQLNQLKIRELSGGERKKVFLSIAFAINPPMLLLDEPTNSLDECGREILCSLLKERQGGAVIISHEDIFDKLAEKIFVVEKGGIISAA